MNAVEFVFRNLYRYPAPGGSHVRIASYPDSMAVVLLEIKISAAVLLLDPEIHILWL